MPAEALACIRCGLALPLDAYAGACPACGPDVVAGLTVTYADMPRPDRAALARGPRSIWRYAHSLPVPADRAVTLGEGMTPLLPLHRLGAEIGLPQLYAKCEEMNPTGSFKDRLASAAVSAAKALFGAEVIASSSTGNAGVAAAAYAARAGIPCVILTTAGAAPPMLAQMQALGAHVLTVPDKAARWTVLGEGVRSHGWYPTSPFFAPPTGSNPFGIEGYKSLAYEIAEDLGWRAPDWMVIPVCYGDSIYGMWKGFRELQELGWVDGMPRFVAAEIYGSLGAALAEGLEQVPMMQKPHETTALSISAPQSTYQALHALRASDGAAVTVPEAAFHAARDDLGRTEGLFVELSAASALAAVRQMRADGRIGPDDTVVCLNTAEGLKDGVDPHALAAGTVPVPGDFEGAMAALVAAGGPDLRHA
jgi:threonine synthase